MWSKMAYVYGYSAVKVPKWVNLHFYPFESFAIHRLLRRRVNGTFLDNLSDSLKRRSLYSQIYSYLSRKSQNDFMQSSHAVILKLIFCLE